ncbi:MAG: amidohydrolase family protein, partial [Chloroflexota bacterium]
KEYAGAAPTRLAASAMLPLSDVNAAVQELHRAVADLGMIGGFMRPNPICGRNLEDRYYDPLYRAAEELGVPLMTHEATGVYVPAAGADRFESFVLTHATSHFFEAMLAVASFTVGGILERFPGLQVIFLEGGCGWLPYWLDRLDEHCERRPAEVSYLSALPSEYFARQCYVTCDPDEKNIDRVVARFGDDKILFASDYPHWDAIIPGHVAELRENPTLSEAAKAKIFGSNAARLFKATAVASAVLN